MLRFPDFERLGLSLAAVTERSDGDFARDHGQLPMRALELAGVEAQRVVTLRQVHGNLVWSAGLDGVEAGAEDEGDGLVTDVPGVALAVRVADCVPVFLFDPEHRAIGLVHAGRMGTYGAIAIKAVQVMRAYYNTNSEDLHALIGPSAGPCCYEVSEQIAAEFTIEHLPVYGRYLDLWEANAQQLTGMGVPRDQIVNSEVCTICDGRFYSHRADGSGGRNLAVLCL